MVEVRVSLGEFQVSLSDLISMREGQRFDFVISFGQTLDLFVGDEKIAEGRLLKDAGNYCLEICKMMLQG